MEMLDKKSKGLSLSSSPLPKINCFFISELQFSVCKMVIAIKEIINIKGLFKWWCVIQMLITTCSIAVWIK